MLLFCNSDENGEIIGSLKGARVVPDRQYDHFFYMQEDIEVSQYRVQADDTGVMQLVPKEAPVAEEMSDALAPIDDGTKEAE